MRVLFEGAVPVAYGQFYVISEEAPDMTAAFAGQANGLCGAGEPGALFLMTGTHTGRVRLRVELHEQEPPAAPDEWADVVEAPFLPRAATVDLLPWDGGSLAELPLMPPELQAGPLPSFRVRYCAAGMDEGRDPYGGVDPHTIADDDHSYMERRPDRYLLCFWPDREGGSPVDGSLRADAIVRQTSRSAGYWHGWAASLAAPPSLWEQVAAAEHERREKERRAEESRLREEARRWGGRPPGDRLRRVRGNVQGIVMVDRDLVDAVAGADDVTQRQIAVWAARQAFARAGLADLDWMAPAWAALERGDPLPADFLDPMTLWARISDQQLSARPGPGHQVVGITRPEPGHQVFAMARQGPGTLGAILDGPVNPAAMAVPALAAAAGPDPLQAALEALWAAITTYADRRAEFLQEVRRAFPTTA